MTENTADPASFGSSVTDRCPCDRMDKPAWLWLCRICYLEKEIGYALSELQRGGNWPAAGIRRLEGLIRGDR